LSALVGEIRGWFAARCAPPLHRMGGYASGSSCRRRPRKHANCRMSSPGLLRRLQLVCAAGVVTADSPSYFDEFAQRSAARRRTIVLYSIGVRSTPRSSLGAFPRLGPLTTVGSVAPYPYWPRARPGQLCSGVCIAIDVRVPSPSGTTRFWWAGLSMSGCIIVCSATAPMTPRRRPTAPRTDVVSSRYRASRPKYTFDMGGAGGFVGTVSYVPPGEDLHELSRKT